MRGRGNSKCKGPKMGMNLAYSRTSKVRVAVAE